MHMPKATFTQFNLETHKSDSFLVFIKKGVNFKKNLS